MSPFPFGFGEEIFFLDLYSEGVDRSQALALGKVQARKIASLLSVFLNVGLYEIPMEARWIYDGEETKCLQLGYKSSIPKPTAMPAKHTECNPGRSYAVNRDEIEKPPMSDEPFRCPKDIRHLFRVFYALPPNDQVAYLGAATMFQISLTAGRNYPSVQMAYAVAAVDALARGKQQTMKTFVELVSELCSEVKVGDIEYLYQKVRSAHFHAGNLPRGEYEPRDLTIGLLVRERGRLNALGMARIRP
jgi:hypothetical protein